MAQAEAIDLYLKHQDNPGALENWSFLAKVIAADKNLFVVNRVSKINREFWTDSPRVTQAILAAEFFADSTPPQLLIAGSILETHDDLRAKHPSAAPRVSGDVIHVKNFPFTFFCIDAVDHNCRELPTKAQLTEVIEWFLSQNIVPLDANMKFAFA